MTKYGAGALTLDGSNTYTGQTTVSDGALIVNGATGFGETTVNSGASLAGTGTVRDNLTVQNGGALQIGDTTPPEEGVISLNVESYGTIPDGPGNTAGVVNADYWNDTWRDHSVAGGALNGFTAPDLQDNSGGTTTLDVTFATNDTWQVNFQSDPGVDGDGTHNKRLLNGYLNNGGGGTTSLSFAEIPYASYDLYVYFSSDTANREGSITDGSTTYYFSTVGASSIAGANAAFTLGTATVPTDPGDGDAGDGDDPLANYVVFSGLSGSSQTITSDILNYGGIAGFQVVADTTVLPMVGETMTVLGDLSLADNSTISFDIAAPGNNDSIAIGGNFSVTDGFVLEVLLDSSVSAGSLLAGASWDLFDFDPNGASGSFDVNDFLLPGGLASGLAWNTSNLLTTGVLGVSLSGDFNFDGRVDGRDFLQWQRNPGIGNLADWEANYGLPVTSSTTAVPEPSAIMLALVGFALAFRSCRD